MKVTKLVALAMALMVLGGAGTAMAKAVRVDLGPFPADDPVEPDAWGRAVLNYAKGAQKTIVQVNVWGLMPNATYTLYLFAEGPGFHIGAHFMTDEEGEGHIHLAIPGNHSMHLPVAINNADNFTVLYGD
jgi:hypothetical protein